MEADESRQERWRLRPWSVRCLPVPPGREPSPRRSSRPRTTSRRRLASTTWANTARPSTSTSRPIFSSRDAALLFNIGQAYRLWDRPEDAIRAYKNYLRRVPDAVNRADVEKKIADLEKLVEDVGVAGAAADRAGARWRATHGARARAAWDRARRRPRRLVPEPAAGPGRLPAGVVVGQSAPAAPAKPKSNWLAYSLLGVGGACLATAIVAAAVGASKAKKLQDASRNKQPFDPGG